MKLDPVTVVVLALAVYRTTVLLTKDYICEPLRSRMRRIGKPPRPKAGSPAAEYFEWLKAPRSRPRLAEHADYLSRCPWCASIWVAAALVPLTALVPWFVWVDAGLASSAVAGVIFERVNEEKP